MPSKVLHDNACHMTLPSAENRKVWTMDGFWVLWIPSVGSSQAGLMEVDNETARRWARSVVATKKKVSVLT